MVVRVLTAAVLALTVLAAACGADPQADVRKTLESFAGATAKKDYQEICDQLIAKSLSDNVEEYGLPCELAFKQGLDSVRKPTLTIRSVEVDGDVAKVRVHSTAANQPPSDDTLELRRSEGEWKITALARPAAETAKPKTG